MDERSRSTFSLHRFVALAIPLAVAAGILWRLTGNANAAFTVWLTKALHGIAGYPAPYMYCDETTLYWHATMFPPVVALTLASYWLRWPQRLLRAAAGYVAHCGMTAIAIAVNESPYVQQTSVLTPLTSTLVNANYLMFGVVIWVLAASPWYAQPARRDPGSNQKDARDGAAATRWTRWASVMVRGWATRVGLLWIAVALVVPLSALLGPASGRAARVEIARALRDVPFFPHPSGSDTPVDRSEQLRRDEATKKALGKLEIAIKTDKENSLASGPLWYLSAHLVNSLRPEDAKLRQQFRKQAAIALIAAKKTRGR